MVDHATNTPPLGMYQDVYAPILPDADEEFIRFREESRFWIQKAYVRFYIG